MSNLSNYLSTLTDSDKFVMAQTARDAAYLAQSGENPELLRQYMLILTPGLVAMFEDEPSQKIVLSDVGVPSWFVNRR